MPDDKDQTPGPQIVPDRAPRPDDEDGSSKDASTGGSSSEENSAGNDEHSGSADPDRPDSF